MPKPWNRIIEVHAFSDAGEPQGVRFELRNPAGSNNPPIQAGNPPRIVFNKAQEPVKSGGGKMKALDWHRVSFQLVDTDSLGLRFHDDRHDALWATASTKCPETRCRHKHFRLWDRADDVLVVRNDNYHIEEIGFTLNFLRPGDDGYDESTFVRCDPVGGNEDRGDGFTYDTMIGVTVAGVSAAALGAALLLRNMLKPAGRSRGTGKARAAARKAKRR